MWFHGLILITILALANCIETDLTVEAAFQGHCGRNSPCEQLCYEIHDGMYECDCTEGYELNKNGYSCQELNSTFQENSMKSEEDILYQKGVSFSAKLDSNFSDINNNNNFNNNNLNNINNFDENDLESSSNNAEDDSNNGGEDEDDDDDENSDDNLIRQKHKNDNFNYRRTLNNENLKNLNVISDENDNDDDDNDNNNNNGDDGNISNSEFSKNVPDYKLINRDVNSNKYNYQHHNHQNHNYHHQQHHQHKQQQYQNDITDDSNISTTTTEDDQEDSNDDDDDIVKSVTDFTQLSHSQITTIPTTSTSTQIPSISAVDLNNLEYYDIYYGKQDMSVYDDVNNNKLNLRPVNSVTYQTENTNSNSNNNNKIIKPSKIIQQITETPAKLYTTTSLPSQLITVTNYLNVHRNVHYKNDTRTDNHKNNITIISNTTKLQNDFISEPCLLDCGPDGSCDYVDDGNKRNIRCRCPFGKTGKFCGEDMKINIPRFTHKSWLAFPALRGAYKHVQLRVEFRPESFDGIILLTGERDDLTGDFMALLIHQGFIEFWFDCGSGVGSVRSKETVELNQWNSATIYRHRWDAWLVLNHGARVQGRSKGLFSRITFREPVFLGGIGNITGLGKRLPVHDGMIGCIRRFIANEHEYKFTEHPLGDVTKGFDIQDCTTDKCVKYPCQHGGKCLPSDQGAVCLCPLGFGGDLCEMRLDLQVPSFNGSSYLRYAPLGDTALIWLELQLIIKPYQNDGILLYSGHEELGDYIALSLNIGYVEFAFDLGSGPALVRSEYPLTLGQWHTIKISRTARLAVLRIDQRSEVMTVSSNGFWHLSLPHSLFLGGIHNVQHLPVGLKERGSFVGCIQKVEINGHSLSIISEALGGTNVDNCPHACVAKPCGPLAECLPILDSYECRCNPYNAQCNKAEEVPLKQIPIITNINNKRNDHQLDADTEEHEEQNPNLKHEEHQKPDESNFLQEHQEDYLKYMNTRNKPAEKTNNNIKPKNDDSHSTTTTIKPIILKGQINSNVRNLISRRTPTDIYYYDYENDENPFNNNNNNNNKPVNGKDLIKLNIEGEEFQQIINQSITTNNGKQQNHQEQKHSHKLNHKKSRKIQKQKSQLSKIENENVHDDDDDDDDYDYEPVIASLKKAQVDVDSDQFIVTTTTTKLNHKKHHHHHTHGGHHNHHHHQHQHQHHQQHNHKNIKEPSIDFHKKNATIADPNMEHENIEQGKNSYRRRQEHSKFLIGQQQESTQNDYEANVLIQDMERIMKNGAGGSGGGGNHLNTNHQNGKDTDENAGYDSNSYDDNDNGDDDDVVTGTDDNTDDFNNDNSFIKVPVARKSLGACFTGMDSYFHYNDAETMSQIISYKIDLNLRFKTRSSNGIVLWSGRYSAQENDDFLSLGIENGYLHFRYNLGSGETNIAFNTSKVSDGLWHRVRAMRNSQEGFLEVDGRKSIAQRSPGKLRQLNTDTGLYVGGMTKVSTYTRRRYLTGIIGCISEIVLAGELRLNLDPATLGTAHNVETGIL